MEGINIRLPRVSSFINLSLRNDTILGEFIKGIYVNITDDDLQQLLDLYPDDPSDGAPYNTGDQYQLAPQWKRIASIAGDIEFDAPHRLIAQTLGNQQPVWSYCTSWFSFLLRTSFLHACQIISATSYTGLAS